MAIKNKSKYAILGVLSLAPRSGYDIKKFCDQSISHFWNENFGHIYPVLSQLSAEGLICNDTGEGDERRKVYSITDEGMDVFCKWLLEPVEYPPARSELLLKMVFSKHISKEKTLEMLESVKVRKQKLLAEYQNIEDSYDRDEKMRQSEWYPYWFAPLRYGILATEAAIAWCDETIVNIRESGASQQ